MYWAPAGALTPRIRPDEVEQVAGTRRRRVPDAAQPLDLEHVAQPARHREEMADGERATR
jgi:hypothetical protein